MDNVNLAQSPHYVLCSGCDLLLQLPALKDNKKAVCPRCETKLTKRCDKNRFISVSYSLCGLFMLLLALIFPFINMRIQGIFTQIYLLQIPQVMLGDNYSSLAIIFSCFVILVPIFCLVTIILLTLPLPINLGLPLRRFLARWLFRCKAWSMGEIFLTGVLVSFVKLLAYGDIGLGLSFIPYCLFSLFQIKALQAVDRYRLWNQMIPAPRLNKQPRIGQTGIEQDLRLCLCCSAILPIDQVECPRCQQKGYARRHVSIQWTLALLVTSIILYIPANMLPIMVTESLGNSLASTIMSGVVYMWEEGSYPVALVIFAASILIPSLKILALLWLCYFVDVKYVAHRNECHRAHIIYEMVEFVGRWSMIDIFVIGVLASLIRFGILMGVYPEIGALLFAMVVFITMIAASKFDPRLLWDRANELTKPTLESINLSEYKTDGIA